LLRLAVLINHSRPEGAPMPPKIAADSNGDALTITLPPSDEPTLLSTDLEQEQAFMANAGFAFNLNTPS
jgi:exopolyphosphatase/guanosine-5'-triphosphate,3'-diphosphate pyrophosphatase